MHHHDNPDVVELLAGYRDFLSDDATFRTVRLGDLLDSGALPAATAVAVRERHLGSAT